jgi:hypothetical protein
MTLIPKTTYYTCHSDTDAPQYARVDVTSDDLLLCDLLCHSYVDTAHSVCVDVPSEQSYYPRT